jgi:hypothetical protein
MSLTLKLISIRRAIIIIVFFCVCFFTYSPSKWTLRLSHSSSLDDGNLLSNHDLRQDPRCKSFPDPGNIAIAVKTGATEATKRIPTQMLTSLKCAKNVIIFSDLEQNIGGYQLHDALDAIPENIIQSNPDFKFYLELKENKGHKQVNKMMNETSDSSSAQSSAAWTLDKYKQLHILEKLYAKYPNKDWYLVIDADSYLVWSNLLLWLNQLVNPSSKLYLGSPAGFGNLRFAHGGSGILMSHATIYDYAVTNNGTAKKWDKSMHAQCCGDLIIGLVLMKRGIILKKSWPTMNGEKPITIPFGESVWCQPVVTMHHVDPDEMNLIMDFENSRSNLSVSIHSDMINVLVNLILKQRPITFADVFHHFVAKNIPNTLDDWDNFAGATMVLTDSYRNCRKACQKDPTCLQFRYGGPEDCTLSDTIRLGQKVVKDASGKTWKSGWLRHRIHEWVEEQEECEPKFPWT